MCGIAGILRITPASVGPEALRIAMVRPHAEAIPEVWLDVLDQSIKHRGPDGQGRFRDRAVRPDGTVVDVAFVHRRLSIIDLAGGAQPMVSMKAPTIGEAPTPPPLRQAGAGEGAASVGVSVPPALLFHGRPDDPVEYRPIVGDDGSRDLCAVVFNGCIYNHRELRKELEAQGQRFVTDHSDTEVLLQGWRTWELRLGEHLDGMYAMGVWDRQSGDLSLWRDGFGEKPLYKFSLQDSPSGPLFAFSSSTAALVKLESLVTGEPPQIDQDTTRGWAQFGWNQATPFRGVRTIWTDWLESTRSIGSDGLPHSHGCSHPWWTIATNPGRRVLDVESVDATLRTAVHSRLESDVSLGVFLSGGIDSSLIARYASEVRPDLRAFTVRMPDHRMDESSVAAQVARHLNIKHEIIDCDSRPSEDLVSLIEQLGLPFGDSSLLPTHWVSRGTRGRITVAIAGDGGDEMFLGYDRHTAMHWLRRLGRLPAEVLAAISPAIATFGGDARSRRSKFARLLNAAATHGYRELLAIFPTPMSDELGIGYRPSGTHWGQTLKPAAEIDPAMHDQLCLRFDRMFYLPEDLLRKSDTASMAVALEVRSPFLANAVVEAAMNAPISSLMPNGQRKGLLRQVARRYLPAAIVDRPKQGFAIPIGDWFRSDFGGMKTLLMDHLGSVEPFGPPRLGIDLNMGFIRRLVDEHMDGRRDHGQRLYMLLVLSIWARWLGRVG